MSLPWDVENIRPNLVTLGQIRRGDHLSVLKDGENVEGDTYTLGTRGLRSLFKIEGKGRQSFVRSKKGETILNDEQYLNMLTRFFREAVGAWGRRIVTGAEVTGAKEGLGRLRDTYRNDQTRRAKIDQILQAVERELRGIRVDGIYLAPNEPRMILGTLPGYRQRIVDIITLPSDTCSSQFTTGVSPEFLTAVFGPDAKPQPETTVPMGRMRYQRDPKSAGVCQQFHTDSTGRNGIQLQGANVTSSRADLRKLFEFTQRDEGMMFAVSQIATQGSLSGVSNLLLQKGGRDGGREAPLIQVGDERLNITLGGGCANITRFGNLIVISTEQKIPGTFYAQAEFDTGFPKLLTEFGISNINLRFSVRLRRVGQEITLDLIESMLKITTV